MISLTIGESLTDIVTRTGHEPTEHPGGSPMNVAVCLGRLGHDSHLLSDIGSDARGRAIAAHLQSSRVSLTPGSVTQRRPTSSATALVDDTGAATYDFDVSWDPDPTGIPQNPDVIHVGSIGVTLEPGAETVSTIVAEMMGKALVSYDPNVRPSLMCSPEQALPRIEHAIAHSDIVKASDEDIAWLYNDADPDDVMHRWLGMGPGLVVVTRGAHGATGLTHTHRVSVGPEPVKVKDTVGAGDTFSAGILDACSALGLAGPQGREGLGELSENLSLIHI